MATSAAFDSAIATLQDASSAFASSMNQYADMSQNGGIEMANINIATGGIYYNGVVNPANITMSDVVFNGRTLPTVNMPTITMGDTGVAPTFSATTPLVNIPVVPALVIPDVNTTPPTFNMPTLPDTPQFTYPAVPTISEVAMPAAPAINLPVFDSTFIDYDLTNTVGDFDWAEAPFQDALMDELKSKLMADLINGGYGIEPADEEGLWMRAVDREVRNSERAIQEANRAAAARGFSLPPGALFAQMESVRQDTMEKNSSVQRDIALKRADLYVQNRQFTIQETRQVEQMLLNYWAGVQERALQAAKALVELGVIAFNSRIARLNYFLEQYKIKAMVYETTLRAALANLEVYKAEMEGVKVSVEVQRSRVDLYVAQLQGIKTSADIYRTEMEASQIQAHIEEIKLNAFRVGIEGFKALVDAKVSVYTAYRAQIEGEMAKVNLYTAQVHAYSSEVEAYKGKIQAAVANVQGQSVVADVQIKNLEANANAYTAEAHAYSARVTALSEAARVKVESYKATTSAQLDNARVAVSAWEATAHTHMAAAGIVGNVAMQNASMANARATAAASTAASIAGTYAAAMGSAVSGISALEADITSSNG